MKVYLATAGEYADYRVLRVFADKEDAEAYTLADRVEDFEVHMGPISTHTKYYLEWYSGESDSDENPFLSQHQEEYNGSLTQYAWRNYGHRSAPTLNVEGWTSEDVHRVYKAQRAKFLAAKTSRQ